MHYVTPGRVADLNRILSERDLAIVDTVAQLRFVSASQLRRIHITTGTPLGNARVARRVLQRLVDLEVLDRLDRRIGGPGSRGSDAYIYVLAIGGQYLAHNRQCLSRTRRRRLSIPGQLFVKHSLAVAELHTRLVEATHAQLIEIHERVAEPACWRRFFTGHGKELILKPDSYVRFSVRGLQQRYFIDVDRGTEGSRTLESRLRIYAQYYLSGSEQTKRREFPKVLWLAHTDKRARVIREVAASFPSIDAAFRVSLFDGAIDAFLSFS